MADAYKGLTIRFGGDTSGLQSALKAATSAAASAQKQISAINKAMKFDPASLSTAATKMQLLENRSQDLAAQLSVTTRKYEELGSSTALGSTKTVSELASETENAGLAAKQALDRYNSLNNELATLYAPINKAARASEEFSAAWQSLTGKSTKNFKIQDVFALNDADYQTAIGALKEAGVVTDDDVQKFEKLRSVWTSVFSENEAAKQVKDFEDLGIKAQTLTSEIKGLSTQMSELRAPTNLASSFESTDAAVKRIDATMETLKEDLRQADEALKLDPDSVENVNRKMKDLAQLSDLAKEKASLLGDEIDSYKDAGIDSVSASMREVSESVETAKEHWKDTVSELSAAKAELSQLESEQKKFQTSSELSDNGYKDLTPQIQQATQRVQELESAERQAAQALDNATDTQRVKELESAFSEASAQAKGYAAAMGDSGQKTGIVWSNVKSLGMTLSATVTPAMMGLGYAAVSSANDIDSAYRDMRKTVNGTEQDFEDLRQSAIDFSTTNVTSADQILSIQAIGGELGVATEDLKTFAETVSNLDIATNLDAETAAQTLGQLGNILGDLTSDKFPNFADALVRLGNNGASTEDQIANVATRIGSMASIAKFTTPEILAWSSTIASTGQGAESAGTSISRTISDIETAVANGGDSLNAFAEIAGMSAEQFASAWESTPSDVLKAFIEGLANLDESGGSAITTLDNLGITSVRQVQSIQGLMQMIEGLDDNLKMSEDAWNGVSDQWGKAGDAASEADAKAEGFSGTLSKLKNIAENAGYSLGNAMLPFLQDVTEAAQKAYESFDGLNDDTKQLIVAGAGLATALGPGLSIVSTLGTSFDTLKDKVKSATTTWSKMTDSMSMARTILGDTATEAEVAALATDGLSTSQKIAATSSQLLTGALGLLKTAALGIGATLLVAGISELVQEFQEAQEHAELVSEATKSMSDIMGDSVSSADNLGDAIGGIEPNTTELMESIRDLNDSVEDMFSEFYTNSATLYQYTSVIDDLANKSNLSASEQFKLQEAVKGYNDIVGTQYSVVDAVNGKIADQDGVLQDNTDQINANADAWRQHAQAEAYSSLATQYLQEQAEASYQLQIAQDNLNDAQNRLSDAQARQNEVWQQMSTMTDQSSQEYRDLANEYANLGTEITNAKADVDTYTQAVDEATGSMNSCSNSAEYMQAAASAAAEGLDQDAQRMAGSIAESVQSMINDYADLGTALDDSGISVDQFAVKMVEAGLSSQDMAGVSAEAFSQWVSESGGDIDYIIGKIKEYNNQPLDDKTSKVTIDTSSVEVALSLADRWNRVKFNNMKAGVYTNYTPSNSASGGILMHADGGIVKHADGFIANNYGPGVKLDPFNVVGENGAEAIVPLTNKRYAMPFVNMIADSVIDRLGSSSTTNNVYITQNVRIVRSGEDMYSAATILNRSALSEARRF